MVDGKERSQSAKVSLLMTGNVVKLSRLILEFSVSNCGFPGYLENGQIHGNGYLYRDLISYRCKAGYRLVGNETRVCQEDGRWQGEPPICVSKSSLWKRKKMCIPFMVIIIIIMLMFSYRNSLPTSTATRKWGYLSKVFEIRSFSTNPLFV